MRSTLPSIALAGGVWLLAAACAGSDSTPVAGRPSGADGPSTAAEASATTGEASAVEALAGLATVGELAPDFELAWLANGERGALSDLRGRVVLLELWHTW